MSSITFPRPTWVLADLLPGARTRDALLVLGGAGLTGLAAQVSLPLPGTPVPVTGQTFAVLLVGAALGWWRALASMAVYLLVGAVGVPWYANGASGWGGPTFGYVAGFLLAGAIVGWLAGRGGDRTPLRTVLTMALGTLLIYAVGVTWLAHSLHVGPHQAFLLGMRPFLVGDAVKVLLAAGLLPTTWRLVRGRDRR